MEKTIKVTNEEAASFDMVVLSMLMQQKLAHKKMWTCLPIWKHIESLNRKLLAVMDEDFDMQFLMDKNDEEL